MRQFIALFVVLSSLAACSHGEESEDTSIESTGAVAWMQSAAEREALCEQTFRAAARSVTDRLRDFGTSGSPPAVIVDIDETILDNSPALADTVLDNRPFSPTAWTEWVNREAAKPVAGAFEFLKHCRNLGVVVVFITNRTIAEESATRSTISKLGYSMDDPPGLDLILSKGEFDVTSDKSMRRIFAGEHFQIIVMIGDDLGDFIDASGNIEERRAKARQHQARWGHDWFMLPNPVYGSWRNAIEAQEALPRRMALRSVLCGSSECSIVDQFPDPETRIAYPNTR